LPINKLVLKTYMVDIVRSGENFRPIGVEINFEKILTGMAKALY